MSIECDDFAVDDAIGQPCAFLGHRAEPVGPVQALAGAYHGFVFFDPQLCAVAVELHLMSPAGVIRRPIDQLGELRLDECGEGPFPDPPFWVLFWGGGFWG